MSVDGANVVFIGFYLAYLSQQEQNVNHCVDRTYSLGIEIWGLWHSHVLKGTFPLLLWHWCAQAAIWKMFDMRCYGSNHQKEGIIGFDGIINISKAFRSRQVRRMVAKIVLGLLSFINTPGGVSVLIL